MLSITQHDETLKTVVLDNKAHSARLNLTPCSSHGSSLKRLHINSLDIIRVKEAANLAIAMNVKSARQAALRLARTQELTKKCLASLYASITTNFLISNILDIFIMRFKTSIRNIQTFSKLTASLSSLGKLAWVRLDDNVVRFTIIPESGTQVWASLSIESIFEDYTIQSATPNNTINLELPLPPLHRALKSAINASSASIRLTKKDGIPVLSLTIITSTINSGNSANGFLNSANQDPFGDNAFREEPLESRDRETVITQDIPIRVLTADSVQSIHEPRVREPDAHIVLPSLIQLKAISDRFTRLALATTSGTMRGGGSAGAAAIPKLELAANMHGSLKLSIATDSLNISSVWTGLTNPELDPRQVEDGEEGLGEHPSTKLKAAGPDAWSTVRIDGRDWGRVLSVGRLGGRVIACFADEHALILYVYLSNYDDGADDSVLTYYISSFSM